MGKTLAGIRDARMGAREAAFQLREALSTTGSYIVLAEFVISALSGVVIDPESLPAPEDFL